MRRDNGIEPFFDLPEKDVLVLNYTMACPLQCDFCCYGCHPRRREKLDFHKAINLISEAAEMDVFSSVGFTGGEVFMFEDELISLSRHLKSKKMPFTVATAGHWASSYDKARELVDVLASNGLKRANISFDTSHAKFIPARFIVYAAKAFASLRIPVYVVGTFLDASQSLERLLPELVDQPQVRFFTKRVAEVGRATKAHVDYSDLDPSERATTCYRQIHHDIVVFWDGTVYPCCSTFNRATPGISVGNVYASSLKDLWARVEGSLLFRTLKREGFGALYKLLTKYDPGFASRLPSLGKYPGA